MRPRGIPAENLRNRSRDIKDGSAAPGFNEAAGNTRGKPVDLTADDSAGSTTLSFNEAAGNTRGKRTARKSLCMKGLPWQSRAVSRRCVATAETATASGEFMGQKYSIIKDLRAPRALPGETTAPKRSIHGGEMRITR